MVIMTYSNYTSPVSMSFNSPLLVDLPYITPKP